MKGSIELRSIGLRSIGFRSVGFRSIGLRSIGMSPFKDSISYKLLRYFLDLIKRSTESQKKVKADCPSTRFRTSGMPCRVRYERPRYERYDRRDVRENVDGHRVKKL